MGADGRITGPPRQKVRRQRHNALEHLRTAYPMMLQRAHRMQAIFGACQRIVNDGLSHSQFGLTDGHVVRWTDWTGVKLATGKLLKSPRPMKTHDVKQEGDRILVDLES